MTDQSPEKTMEVKYLRRNIMNNIPKGAVRDVPVGLGKSLIARGVAVAYTKEQRAADEAAEKAAEAKKAADEEAERAFMAAAKQAEKAREKELRASQRTPHVPLPRRGIVGSKAGDA